MHSREQNNLLLLQCECLGSNLKEHFTMSSKVNDALNVRNTFAVRLGMSSFRWLFNILVSSWSKSSSPGRLSDNWEKQISNVNGLGLKAIIYQRVEPFTYLFGTSKWHYKQEAPPQLYFHTWLNLYQGSQTVTNKKTRSVLAVINKTI
jgi:hypothetical protein